MNIFQKHLKKKAPFGTWPSEITAKLLTESAASIQEMVVDGTDTYILEVRQKNKGYRTIVRLDDKNVCTDMTPEEFDACSSVHEYGGGSFTVANGIIYASCGHDGSVYIIENKNIRRLTPLKEISILKDNPLYEENRFANFCVTPYGLLAVGEHHKANNPVENFLALIDLKTGNFKKIAEGQDFYASPTLSPDKKKLAWISWKAEEMPWTHSQLFTADFNDEGDLYHVECVAGKIKESILQPEWSENNTLYFITDRDKGFWNIHRYREGVIENICPLQGEVGEPFWVFGKSSYTLLDNTLYFSYTSKGLWKLNKINLETLISTSIPREAVTIHNICKGLGCIRFIEGYTDKPSAVIEIKDDASFNSKILYALAPSIEIENISQGVPIEFKSENRTAFGYYYPPVNKEFIGLDNEAPPLIVMIHGGPTSQAKNALNIKYQYWTNKGFAILDVNYSGSSGYGRDYRLLLNNNWGVIDVLDCINGVKALVERKLVDKNKLFIRGGSSGGFTVLTAIAKSSIFLGAASLFGVSDLKSLANDTHKFEAHYLDQLIGKYSETKHLWEERSPINFIDKIKTPLIIFQGELDKIVPKNQSIKVYEALIKNHVPVEIYLYPNEGHGFRAPENIIDSLEKETQFYLKLML